MEQAVAEVHLDGAPTGAARARALAASFLADAPEELLHDVQLALTELVSNAMLHGAPPVAVRLLRQDDGAVRVEVEDAGHQLLVMPVPSTDAMTGRGLSLVAALADSWGVDPGIGGGKSIWVVLRSGQQGALAEDAHLPDIDLAAILAGWANDEPEPVYTVRLGAVPTDLLLAAKRHVDAVVRELTFVRAGAVGGASLPKEVEALIDTVTGSFARARAAIKRQAAEAATRGDVETDLTLTLPASSADAGERYLTALDEVDRYARDARLLTLETPPLHALFRRWYVQALVDQLRARSRGEQPSPPRPFVRVLSDEVTELASLRDTAHRLELLQRINAELAAVTSAQEMADVVVATMTTSLGAFAARVLIAEGEELETLAVAGGTREWVEEYRSIPLTADLPAPVVFQTGEPVALSPNSSASERFRDLGSSWHDDRAIHIVPIVAGTHRLGVLTVTFPPLNAMAEDTQTSFVQAVADVLAQALELHALRAQFESDRQRWDLAIDAAGVGSFDWDLGSGRLDWDERMQDLFGYAPGEFRPHIDNGFDRIDPQDRPALDQAIAAAVETCGDFHAEYRVRLPAGGTRWISARGRVFAGPDGTAARLVGTAHETTDLRTARDEAARLMETMATGFLALDREWRITFVNGEGGRVAGRPPDELLGRDLWESFPGLEDSDFGAAYKLAMDSRRPSELEAYYAHLEGWYEVRIEPSAEGLYLYFIEVTGRRADRHRAEAATARLELLATVNEQLAAAGLDVEGAVARLSRIVVPALADCCLVSLSDDAGRLRDVGHWHSKPELRDALDLYVRERLKDRADPGAVQQARDTREPVIVESGVMAWVMPMLGTDLARQSWAELALESIVVVPLVARGSMTGVLTLCRGADRPPMSFDEVVTAREVASRAALALDNARLFAEQRSLAEGLQRSLMTTPPQPGHTEIAVRYVPAAKSASVGGDWYDALQQRDGATVLVIGDVMGHDTVAAAAMGQVRGLLRGIAWHSGDAPAQVLAGLDAAMRGLQIDTTATAVVARLEQSEAERADGLTRLRWSNAGHPPPLAVTPGGVVEVLHGDTVDLLLGIDPSSPRTENVTTLPWESTVLLYSDGLIERRGQDLDEGLRLLCAHVAELSSLPLAELCDELLRRMLPVDADDDAALVAVRLHPQDQPRPAAAVR